MLKKLKAFVGKIGNKGKAMFCTAIAAVSTCAMAVMASAETSESGLDMATVMKNAGDQLGNSFNSLVQTMIPVILGIMGTAIVIYGIIALIKLGKKIFGHVAG